MIIDILRWLDLIKKNNLFLYPYLIAIRGDIKWVVV